VIEGHYLVESCGHFRVLHHIRLLQRLQPTHPFKDKLVLAAPGLAEVGAKRNLAHNGGYENGERRDRFQGR